MKCRAETASSTTTTTTPAPNRPYGGVGNPSLIGITKTQEKKVHLAAPPHGYAAPAKGYAALSSTYGVPAYGPPQTSSQGYGAPSKGYGVPSQSYGPPLTASQGYSAPSGGYSSPAHAYKAPEEEYATPSKGYGVPSMYSSPNHMRDVYGFPSLTSSSPFSDGGLRRHPHGEPIKTTSNHVAVDDLGVDSLLDQPAEQHGSGLNLRPAATPEASGGSSSSGGGAHFIQSNDPLTLLLPDFIVDSLLQSGVSQHRPNPQLEAGSPDPVVTTKSGAEEVGTKRLVPKKPVGASAGAGIQFVQQKIRSRSGELIPLNLRRESSLYSDRLDQQVWTVTRIRRERRRKSSAPSPGERNRRHHTIRRLISAGRNFLLWVNHRLLSIFSF